MLFNIDEDAGSQIVGWLLPDNPAVTPRIQVYFNDEENARFEATVYRPLLKAQGLHNTGICGFVINEQNCPGISDVRNLRIYDTDTLMLIYRRRPDTATLNAKLLMVETRLLQLASLNEPIANHFHMVYTGIDLFPEETICAVLGVSFTNSVFVSGRVYYRTFEYQARDREFKTAIMLRDPYEELAERLLVLSAVNASQGGNVQRRLGRRVLQLAEVLKGSELSTAKGIETAIDSIDDDFKALLFNSLTNQLSLRNFEDVPDPRAIATALDCLAGMDAVGVRDNRDEFLALLAAVLDLKVELPRAAVESFPSVQRLAEVLRGIPVVRSGIEMDAELYNTVSDAIAGAGSRRRR